MRCSVAKSVQKKNTFCYRYAVVKLLKNFKKLIKPQENLNDTTRQIPVDSHKTYRELTEEVKKT